MTTEGSTLLSNSQLRHAGLPGGVAGVAAPGPRLEGGGARGVSGERLQLNTGLHRHNLTGDRELKVSSEDINLVLSRNIVLRKYLCKIVNVVKIAAKFRQHLYCLSLGPLRLLEAEAEQRC